MGYRQYDWECVQCETQRTELVWNGDTVEHTDLDCVKCGETICHRRIISMPAVYAYERAFMPEVHGGKWDTQGGRTLPRLPTLPNGATYDQARDIFRSQEYKEKTGERLAAIRENNAKKQRAEAIKRGANLDLKNCPLPGDPKLERTAGKRRKAVR